MPLSYQWLMNGTNLTDGASLTELHATASLTVRSPGTNLSGSYFIVDVTNQFGQATSSSATLNVFFSSPATNSGSLLAGASGTPGTNDGTGTSARFEFPWGLAVNGSNGVFVADTAEDTVRRITSLGVVTTIAGQPLVTGTNDGINGSARFDLPRSLALDTAGDLFVADAGNHAIRKLTHAGANWTTTTVAGQPGTSGTNDGIGNAAQFFSPYGITVDASNNLFVADTSNHTIRKIQPVGTNWMVTTIAGVPKVSGTNDGAGGAALFDGPRGLAADAKGNLYVADTQNQCIRKVAQNGSTFSVTTLAGLPRTAGNVDGTNGTARFNSPTAIAVDRNGLLFVADLGNNAIRQVTPAGVVTTFTNGLSFPAGVAVDASEDIYVANTTNATVLEFRASPAVSPPGLACLVVANQLVLYWPATANGYVLEFSPTLGTSSN